MENPGRWYINQMPTSPPPLPVGRRDIMGHLVGYNKKSTVSVISQLRIYYQVLIINRKHRIIPNQETTYKTTDLESSKMINLMKNQRRCEELLHIKEIPGRWQLGLTRDPELESWPLRRCCWNKLAELESDLWAQGVQKFYIPFLQFFCHLKTRFFSLLDSSLFMCCLPVIYMLSSGLVHRFHWLQHSQLAQSASLPQCLQQSKPS